MNKILTEIDFSKILLEGQATTQTGQDLLTKYRAILMANEASCALVNNFIREANSCRYDNGVVAVLEQVADFVNSNKTRWQIATACENIGNNNSAYNYLNANAAKQAQHLVDLNEDECVKYIKAGGLKNIMWCESFRTIAKSVFKNSDMVIENAEFKITHPVSITEKQGNELYFSVNRKLFKIDENKAISEAQWSEVSNTFKNIVSLLESNLVTLVDETFCIKYGNSEYQLALNETLDENNQNVSTLSITKVTGQEERELTIESLREDNRMMCMTSNPRFRNQTAQVLECVAQLAENLNKVFLMDYVSIVESANDKFLVIESEANVYATLITSRRNTPWTINEEAMKALDFIKSKTKVDLSEQLHEAVQKNISQVSEEEKAKIETDLKNKSIDEMKKRIEALTERYKDDPAKMALLAKLAKDVQEL